MPLPFLLRNKINYGKINLVMKMDLPGRKRTRLKKYDYSQDGYYFITICSITKNVYFHILFAALNPFYIK